jgi:mono/diheme cytochrome c family protein
LVPEIKIMNKLGVLLFLLTLVGEYAAAEENVEGRWFSPSLLQTGKGLFEEHCMACHGTNGQGMTENWKKPLADGSYPPPPINGSAHAWHHPLSVLLRTISNGGVPLGGKMPGFKTILTDEEMLAVVAYFQHWWTDEIYNTWVEHGGLQN